MREDFMKRHNERFDKQVDLHNKWFNRIFSAGFALVIIAVGVGLTFAGAVFYGLYLLYTGQLFP